MELADQDWELLSSLLPGNWRELAAETGALKGLRKNKSADGLLRTLLMHLGCGHSLRETVARARAAGLADLSDVALLKRLRKSEEWLRRLCVELFRENGATAEDAELPLRAFDGTTVKEPGRGSLWRLHYGVRLPSLECDFFELTSAKGSARPARRRGWRWRSCAARRCASSGGCAPRRWSTPST